MEISEQVHESFILQYHNILQCINALMNCCRILSGFGCELFREFIRVCGAYDSFRTLLKWGRILVGAVRLLEHVRTAGSVGVFWLCPGFLRGLPGLGSTLTLNNLPF